MKSLNHEFVQHFNQRTIGPLNAHLKSAINTNTRLNFMVYSSSAGADEAPRPRFFRIINILSFFQISCKFFSSNDILTVFPIQMHSRPMLTLP